MDKPKGGCDKEHEQEGNDEGICPVPPERPFSRNAGQTRSVPRLQPRFPYYDTRRRRLVGNPIDYYDGEQIRACEEAGIATLVPKPITSNSRAEGRFDKRDFVYDTRRDEYRCPAGERAIFRFATIEKGMTIRKYWSSACPGCALQPRCTTSKYRRIAPWEHEAVLDRMQRRLDRAPQTARLRRQTVEHVFGTLKSWMGSTHFLTRTLPRVRTEVSLQVVAYNMKRVMNLLGTTALMEAMAA